MYLNIGICVEVKVNTNMTGYQLWVILWVNRLFVYYVTVSSSNELSTTCDTRPFGAAGDHTTSTRHQGTDTSEKCCFCRAHSQPTRRGFSVYSLRIFSERLEWAEWRDVVCAIWGGKRETIKVSRPCFSAGYPQTRIPSKFVLQLVYSLVPILLTRCYVFNYFTDFSI